MEIAAADWSALPGTALSLISDHLAASSEEDYVGFRSVCSSWRVAAPRLPNLPPLLAVRQRRDHVPNALFSFFRFDGERVAAPAAVQLLDPSPLSFVCSNFSCGWLTILETSSDRIFLWNPVTGARIRLPSFHGGFDKIVLSSSDPATSIVVLLCIANFPKLLWLCRPQNEVWAPIETASEFNPSSLIDDMVLHEGRIYLTDTYSIYTLTETGSSSVARLERIPRPRPPDPVYGVGRWYADLVKEVYLLESSGELLLVDIHHGEGMPFARVFQLVLLEGDPNEHVRLQDLGDRAVFVGGSNSFSLRPSEFPGLKRNCIYRAYDKENNVRIIHLEGNRNELIQNSSDYFNYKESRCRAWFSPSFI